MCPAAGGRACYTQGVDIGVSTRAQLETARADLHAIRGTQVLAGRGIDSILLRGPAVAERLYSPSERVYRDADLLVSHGQLEAARAALLEAGYRDRAERLGWVERLDEHALTLVSEIGGSIDLHWTLHGISAAPSAVWPTLAAHARDHRLGGSTVSALDDEALALVIALHAIQHADTAAGKPQEDLRRALDQFAREIWDGSRRLARSLDCEAHFAAGLRLSPTGRGLAEDLGLAAGSDLDTALMLVAATPTMRGYSQFRKAGRRDKAAIAWRKTFPSQSEMRAKYPWASRSKAHLAASYGYRVLWIGWHLPKAIARYRAASRQAGITRR